jgi:hypothetical protein
METKSKVHNSGSPRWRCAPPNLRWSDNPFGISLNSVPLDESQTPSDLLRLSAMSSDFTFFSFFTATTE